MKDWVQVVSKTLVDQNSNKYVQYSNTTLGENVKGRMREKKKKKKKKPLEICVLNSLNKIRIK